METAAPVRHAHATRFTLVTGQPAGFVDLTDRLIHFVDGTGLTTGTVTVQTLHTTSAIVVNEAEPLLLADFEAFLDRLAPKASVYRHDDMSRRLGVPLDEPPNGHAHCRALVLPTSVTLTVVDGRLVLGRWQRVLFVELDGPRRREVSAVCIGEAL